MSEIVAADLNKNYIVLNGNVRIIGDIKQGEGTGAPSLQNILSLKAETGAVTSALTGTPEPLFGLKIPFATWQCVNMSGSVSSDTLDAVVLKAPAKVQRSNKSTVIATFADTLIGC